jgi:hypothetical protein
MTNKSTDENIQSDICHFPHDDGLSYHPKGGSTGTDSGGG